MQRQVHRLTGQQCERLKTVGGRPGARRLRRTAVHREMQADLWYEEPKLDDSLQDNRTGSLDERRNGHSSKVRTAVVCGDV